MSFARFGLRDLSRSSDRRTAPRRRRGKRALDRGGLGGLRAEGLESRRLLAANVNQINTTFANGTYGVGTTIPIVVEFDELVTVTGPAWLYMNSGGGFNPVTGIGSPNGVARWAFSSFDGRSHTFLYQVTAGDSTPDLDVFASNAIGDTIVNGTFRDSANVVFTPTLPVAPLTNRLSFLKDIVIDTSAPVVPTVNPLRINPRIEITDPPYWQQHPDYFTLTGTAGTTALPAGEVLTVTVNGATFRPTVAADGTWSIDMRHDLPGVTNPWSTIDRDVYDVVARVTDTSGNASVDATLGEVTIDMDPPSIAGLVTTQAPGSYRVGDTIRFSVVFDEAIALGGGGFGDPATLPYIVLTNGARATVDPVTPVTGSRLNFVYTIRTGDLQATNLNITPTLWLNGQRIQDLAANQPTDLNGAGTALTLPTFLTLPTGITVDATLPAVVATRGLAVNGWYGPGQTIVLQVEFSEPVVVNGALELLLNSSPTARATMIPPLTPPGTPTNTLNFTYTVAQGDSTTSFANPNGILAPSSAGALRVIGAGSIADLAGNAANLTLPTTVITAAGGIGNSYSITSRPVVSGVTSPNLNGTYTAGDQITFIVQFDRPIEIAVLPGTGNPVNAVVPSLQLNALPTAPQATYDAVVQTDADKAAGRFILTYTVAAGESTPVGADLDYLATTSLQSGGYAITHLKAPHVPADLTLPLPGTASIGSFDYFKNIRIVQDTINPLSPTLRLVDGTGFSPADSVTFNPTVTVTGLEPLSTWQYSVDGGVIWSGAIRSGAATTFLLPEGIYMPGDVQVRQTDASGNTGPAGVNASTWNVDQTAPNGVTATYVDTAAVDGITSNPTVTVGGLAAGEQVEYSTDAGQTWNTAPGATFNLPAAFYNAGVILVRATDVAGNTGRPFPVNPDTPLTIDRTAAALTVSLLNDTGVSAIDRVTADPTLDFGTSLEAGAAVEYFNGTWTPSYNPVEGDNNILVRQVDVAGNASPSTRFAFTLDRTAPLAVTISLQFDSGSSAVDNVTSSPTLNVQGQEAGASLEYSVNGGAWTTGYAPADGVVTVQVRQRDLVGNVSAASAPLTFTLDRTAPSAPTALLANDTGISGADRITANGSLVIGGLDAGATVLYSVNGTAYSTAYGPVEGANTVLIKQLDLAGNESVARTFTFVLDTIAPAAPTVALQSDTGSSSTDGVTSVGTLVISNREANAVVEYSTDGINWSQSYTPVEGLNAVWVRQRDLAGNGSAPATIFSFTLDRVAPVAPTVFLQNDTGASPSDRVSRVGTIGVTTSEVPVDVSFSVTNGIVWVTGQPTPIEGINNLLVRVTDLAGNNSASTPFSFTYDTVAPMAPIVTLLNDTGLSATDNVTTDPRLNVTGLVSGAVVEYSLDGNSWGLVQPTAVEGVNTVLVRQTDPAGNTSAWTAFTFTLASAMPPAVSVALQADTGVSPGDRVTSNPALAVSGVVLGGVVQYSTNGVTWSTTLAVVQGANTVLVRQMNPAGAFSLPTAFTYVFDSIAPSAPGLSLENDTGTSPTDRITRDPDITVSGLESGATLEYSTNAGQTWGSTYSIAPGTNTVLARQVDVAGNTSAASTITLVFDITTPAAPGVTLQSDTGTSSSDRVTRNPALVLSGLEGNAAVSYSTDGGNNWAGTFVAAEGVNTVLVRQTDAAGNVSSPSTSFTFTLDVTNPTVTNVTSPNADGTYTPGQTVQIVVAVSETVVLTAGTSATLALNTGRNAVLATPANTPTTSLTFNYTVQAGDTSADLDYTSSAAMVVTSGSVRDVAGNDLIPTLPVPVPSATFRALGTKSLGGSLGSNKNIVISSLLIATPGFGSASATLAPQVRSAVTVIPIQFNMPVSNLTLSSLRLLLNNRVQSLKGATLTGSGTSWTLRLPSVATNLRGIYRLDIFGVTAANGVGMGGRTASTFWRRA